MKTKWYLGLALLATTALLSGCSTQEYTSQGIFTTKAQLSSAMTEYDIYLEGYAQYYIPEDLFTAKECDNYINQSSKFLAAAAYTADSYYEEYSIPTISVYVAPDLVTYGDDYVAYINSDDINSVKGYTALLTALIGEDCNYGQAYGFSAALLTQKHIAYDTPYEEGLAEAIADNTGLLRFYMPEFETTFVDEDTASLVETAAYSFGQYFANHYGIEQSFASIVGPNEFLEQAKNDWLNYIGCTTTYEEPENPLIFRHSWNDYELYPYVTSTKTMNVYFRVQDVVDTGFVAAMEQAEPMLYDAEYDFLGEQDCFNAFTGEVDPVDVYTMFSINNSELEEAGAMYLNDFNKIIIYYNWDNAIYSLDHEYAHYLTIQYNLIDLNNAPNWIMEGYAEEIAAYEAPNTLQLHYFQKLIDTQSELFESDAKENGYWDEANQQLDTAAYNEFCARELVRGAADGSNYFTVGHETKVRGEINSLNDLTYNEAASMIRYLINQNGLDNFLAVARDYSQFEDIYGVTPMEAYAAWKAQLFPPQ